MSTTSHTTEHQHSEAAAAILKLSKSAALLFKSERSEESVPILQQMRQDIEALGASLGAHSHVGLERFSSALGKLIQELLREPGRVNPSPVRTIVHALDFLRVSLGSRVFHDQLERMPLKVLVVDDDLICLRALTMSLKGDLTVATSCPSAKEALELLRGSRMDVIFSDVLMPEMNGFEFCGELRKMPQYSDTPVIFVTALTDFGTRSQSKLMGGCDFVVKPFTPSEILLKTLNFGLRHRTTHPEASVAPSAASVASREAKSAASAASPPAPEHLTKRAEEAPPASPPSAPKSEETPTQSREKAPPIELAEQVLRLSGANDELQATAEQQAKREAMLRSSVATLELTVAEQRTRLAKMEAALNEEKAKREDLEHRTLAAEAIEQAVRMHLLEQFAIGDALQAKLSKLEGRPQPVPPQELRKPVAAQPDQVVRLRMKSEPADLPEASLTRGAAPVLQ